MDQEDRITEALQAPTKAVVKTVTYTTIISIELKYIYEVVDTTYADGSEKQDMHDRSETPLSVDRDKYTETPQGEV